MIMSSLTISVHIGNCILFELNMATNPSTFRLCDFMDLPGGLVI